MRKTCITCGNLCGVHNQSGYCAICCMDVRKCVLDGCSGHVTSASRLGLCSGCNTSKARDFVKSNRKDVEDSERKSILRERLPAWIKKHVRVKSLSGASSATIVDFNRMTLRVKFKLDSSGSSYSKPLYLFLSMYEQEPE